MRGLTPPLSRLPKLRPCIKCPTTSNAMSVHQSSMSTFPYLAATSYILWTVRPVISLTVSCQFSSNNFRLIGLENMRRRTEWSFALVKVNMDLLGLAPVNLWYQSLFTKSVPMRCMWWKLSMSLTASSFGAMRTCGPYFLWSKSTYSGRRPVTIAIDSGSLVKRECHGPGAAFKRSLNARYTI